MALKNRVSSRDGIDGGGLVQAARVIASPTTAADVGGVVPLGCTGCPNDCDGNGGVRACYDVWGAYWFCDTWEVRYQGRICGLPANTDFRETEQWFGTSTCYATLITRVPQKTCANTNGECNFEEGELDDVIDNPPSPPTSTPTCTGCTPPSSFTVSDQENYSSEVTETTNTDWIGCSGALDYIGCNQVYFNCKRTYTRSRLWAFDVENCEGVDVSDTICQTHERTDKSFDCRNNTDYSACDNATLPGYCTSVLPPAPTLKQSGIICASYIGSTLLSYFKRNYKDEEIACRETQVQINCSTSDPDDSSCPDTYGALECDPAGTETTVTTTLRDDSKYEIVRTVTTEIVNSSNPVDGSCPSGTTKCGNSGYNRGDSFTKTGSSTYTRTVVTIKFDPCP